MLDKHGRAKLYIGIIIIVLAILALIFYALHSTSSSGTEIANIVFIFVGFASLYVISLNVYDEFKQEKKKEGVHIVLPHAQIIQTSPGEVIIKSG